MDLELSDEQTGSASRSRRCSSARGGSRGRHEAGEPCVELSALGVSVGGEDGLGAVELCLVGALARRAPGPCAVPRQRRRAFAAEPLAADLEDRAVALAVLEPGASWAAAAARTVLEPADGWPCALRPQDRRRACGRRRRARRRRGRAAGPGARARRPRGAGVAVAAQPAFDPTAPRTRSTSPTSPLVREPTRRRTCSSG